MQRCAFTPYEGDKPYIFVSYAHKDSARVFPVLEELDRRGYRIWYDDGIAPGSEWPENIAQHLDGCSLTLAFISPASIASANCRREITFALSKRKPFLGILLQETEMSLGMEMQLSAQQCIMKYTYPSEAAFYQKVCSCPDLAPCLGGTAPAPAAAVPAVKSEKQKPLLRQKPDKKTLGILAGAAGAVIALAVVLILILGGGSGNPADVSTGHSSPAVQADTMTYTGKTITAEDAAQIAKQTGLQTLVLKDCTVETDAFAAAALPGTLKTLTFENCNGLETLPALKDLGNLETLQVINCGISALPELPASLKIADLSGNGSLGSLSALKTCTGLQELNFRNTGVSSLADLSALTGLTAIDGSYTKVTDLSVLADLKTLLCLRFAGCGIASIEGTFRSLYLNELDLSENRLTSLQAFANCTVLSKADVSYNLLTETDPLSKSAASLRVLDLSGNTGLNALDVKFVGQCTKLAELSMDGLQLYDLDMVSDLRLTRLCANNCHISDISGIHHTENLQVLSLAFNAISDLSPLSDLPEGLILDLSFNSGLQDISALDRTAGYTYLGMVNTYVPAGDLDSFQGQTLGTLPSPDMLDGSKFQPGGFAEYVLVSCPADQKVTFEMLLGKDRVLFAETDEDYAAVLEALGIDSRYLLTAE